MKYNYTQTALLVTDVTAFVLVCMSVLFVLACLVLLTIYLDYGGALWH